MQTGPMPVTQAESDASRLLTAAVEAWREKPAQFKAMQRSSLQQMFPDGFAWDPIIHAHAHRVGPGCITGLPVVDGTPKVARHLRIQHIAHNLLHSLTSTVATLTKLTEDFRGITDRPWSIEAHEVKGSPWAEANITGISPGAADQLCVLTLMLRLGTRGTAADNLVASDGDALTSMRPPLMVVPLKSGEKQTNLTARHQNHATAPLKHTAAVATQPRHGTAQAGQPIYTAAGTTQHQHAYAQAAKHQHAAQHQHITVPATQHPHTAAPAAQPQHTAAHTAHTSAHTAQRQHTAAQLPRSHAAPYAQHTENQVTQHTAGHADQHQQTACPAQQQTPHASVIQYTHQPPPTLGSPTCPSDVNPPSIVLSAFTTGDNSIGPPNEKLHDKTARMIATAMASLMGHAAALPGAEGYHSLTSRTASLDFYSIHPGGRGHTVRMFAPRATIDRLISGGLTKITVKGAEDLRTGAKGINFTLTQSPLRSTQPQELHDNMITMTLPSPTLIQTPEAALRMLRAMDTLCRTQDVGGDHGPVCVQRACGAFDIMAVTDIPESEALDFVCDKNHAPLSSTDTSSLQIGQPWRVFVSTPRQIDTLRLMLGAHQQHKEAALRQARPDKTVEGPAQAPAPASGLGPTPAVGFAAAHRFGTLPRSEVQPLGATGAVGGPLPPGKPTSNLTHSQAGACAVAWLCGNIEATKIGENVCPPIRSATVAYEAAMCLVLKNKGEDLKRAVSLMRKAASSCTVTQREPAARSVEDELLDLDFGASDDDGDGAAPAPCSHAGRAMDVDGTAAQPRAPSPTGAPTPPAPAKMVLDMGPANTFPPSWSAPSSTAVTPPANSPPPSSRGATRTQPGPRAPPRAAAPRTTGRRHARIPGRQASRDLPPASMGHLAAAQCRTCRTSLKTRKVKA